MSESTQHGGSASYHQTLRERMVDKYEENAEHATTMRKWRSNFINFVASSGDSVMIDRIPQGHKPKSFLQDIAIRTFPHDDGPFDQIDYNCNQYGDGLVRRRFCSRVTNDMVRDAYDKSLEQGVYTGAELSMGSLILGMAAEQLEEDAGINNQPISFKEFEEAMDLIDGLKVVPRRPDARPPLQ